MYTLRQGHFRAYHFSAFHLAGRRTLGRPVKLRDITVNVAANDTFILLEPRDIWRKKKLTS